METKLTLRLDEMVINSAKRYAHHNNRSLSKLVEDYFKNLVSKDDENEEYPPIVKRLSGIISNKDLKELSKKDDRVKYILRENR
jgi:uncharacterized protein YfdQ (DUF2303 family)